MAKKSTDETAEILADKELMAAIEASSEDVAAGRVHDQADVFAELATEFDGDTTMALLQTDGEMIRKHKEWLEKLRAEAYEIGRKEGWEKGNQHGYKKGMINGMRRGHIGGAWEVLLELSPEERDRLQRLFKDELPANAAIAQSVEEAR